MTKDRAQTIDEFRGVVNMTAEELEQWLSTSDSNAVGLTKPGEHESTGHQSGRRIVDLLQKSDEQYNDDDLAHMSKVVSYVKRHMAQRPERPDYQLEHMKWTSSLKNWGHDPLKHT